MSASWTGNANGPVELDLVQKTQVRILRKSPSERLPEDLVVLAASFEDVKFFKQLDQHAVVEVCRAMTVRKYRGGRILFSEGDSGDEFFIILSGAISVLISQPSAQTEEVATEEEVEAEQPTVRRSRQGKSRASFASLESFDLQSEELNHAEEAARRQLEVRRRTARLLGLEVGQAEEGGLLRTPRQGQKYDWKGMYQMGEEAALLSYHALSRMAKQYEEDQKKRRVTHRRSSTLRGANSRSRRRSSVSFCAEIVEPIIDDNVEAPVDGLPDIEALEAETQESDTDQLQSLPGELISKLQKRRASSIVRSLSDDDEDLSDDDDVVEPPGSGQSVVQSLSSSFGEETASRLLGSVLRRQDTASFARASAHRKSRMVTVATLRRGDSFGETALDADVTRTATTLADEDTWTAVLRRQDYNRILTNYLEERQVERSNFASNAPILSTLNDKVRSQIAGMLRVQEVARNEVVCPIGAPVTQVYFLAEGEFGVEVSSRASFTTETSSRQATITTSLLDAPAVFGLSAFLQGERNHIEGLVCRSLLGKVYTLLSKNLIGVISKEIKHTYSLAASAQKQFHSARATVLREMRGSQEAYSPHGRLRVLRSALSAVVTKDATEEELDVKLRPLWFSEFKTIVDEEELKKQALLPAYPSRNASSDVVSDHAQMRRARSLNVLHDAGPPVVPPPGSSRKASGAPLSFAATAAAAEAEVARRRRRLVASASAPALRGGQGLLAAPRVVTEDVLLGEVVVEPPIEPNKEEDEPIKEEDEDAEDEIVDELEERQLTAAPRFSMFKDILVMNELAAEIQTPKKEVERNQAVTRSVGYNDDELDDEIEEVDDLKESQDEVVLVKDSIPRLLKYKTAPQLAFNQKDVLSTLKKALESTKTRFSVESIPPPASRSSVSTSPRKSSQASRATVTSVVFPCMVLEPLPVTPRLTKGRSLRKTKSRETMGMEARSSLVEVSSPSRRTRERGSQQRSSIAETPRHQGNRSFQADSIGYSFDDVYTHPQDLKVADHLVQTEQNKGFLPRIPMKGSLSGVVRDDLVCAPPEELEGVMSFFSPSLAEVSSTANMSAAVYQISTASLHNNLKKGVYFPSPKTLQSKVLEDSVDLHQVYEWSRLPKVHRGRRQHAVYNLHA